MTHQWEEMHPSFKIVIVLIWMVMVFICQTWLSLAILLGLIVFLVLATGGNSNTLAKTMRTMLPLVFITVLFSSLAINNPTYRILGIIPVSYLGFINGIKSAIRMLLLIILAFALTMNTTGTALIRGIYGLFKPAARIGLPVKDISMICSLAISFIPLLYAESERISRAQIARGASLEYGNLVRRSYQTFYLVVPVMISSLRKADKLAVAMDARGYCGGVGSTSLYTYKIGWREFSALFTTLLMIIGIVWLN